MRNNHEKKITMCNGRVMMQCNIATKSSNCSFSIPIKLQIVNKFAVTAVQQLKLACRSALTEGLFRVDIFQTKTGKLVVNEFESLEADYATKEDKDRRKVYNYLTDYWISVLTQFA